MNLLEHAPSRLKNNLRFVSMAISHTPMAIKDAGSIPRSNFHIMKEVILQNADLLEYASDTLKNNKKLVRLAIEKNSWTIVYAGLAPRNDFDLMKHVVANHGILLEYASDTLKNNQILVNIAIEQNPNAIQYASTELRNNFDLMKNVVTHDAMLLKYASIPLRDNSILVQFALDQNIDAIQYAGFTLRNNKRIMRSLIKKKGSLLQYASDPLKSNRILVNIALRQDPANIVFASNTYLLQTYGSTFYDLNQWNLRRMPFDFSTTTVHITLKTYQHYIYPIVTLPKGCILYTYVSNVDDLNKQFYRLDSTDPIEKDQTFFYPLPYMAHGVSSHYNECIIVKTLRDIQLVCLLSPTCLSRGIIRTRSIRSNKNNRLNYYGNDFCEDDIHMYDIRLQPHVMKALGVQGYIGIAKEDSISHGVHWKRLLQKGIPLYKKRMFDKILEQAIYKSSLCYNMDNNDEGNRLYLPDIVTTSVDLKHFLFSIPEIAICPLHSEYFDEMDRDALRKTSYEERQLYMNYVVLQHVKHLEELPHVLYQLSSNWTDWVIYPTFHMETSHNRRCKISNPRRWSLDTVRNIMVDIVAKKILLHRVASHSGGDAGQDIRFLSKDCSRFVTFKKKYHMDFPYDRINIDDGIWFEYTMVNDIPIFHFRNDCTS